MPDGITSHSGRRLQAPSMSAHASELGNWSAFGPTRLTLAPSISLLPEVLHRLRLSRGKLLVCTGVASSRKLGYLDAVLKALPSQLSAHVVEGVPSDPPLAKASEAAHLIAAERFVGIIALGGGSVIDFAKVAASFAGYDGELEPALRRGGEDIPSRAIPLIAIPTTAGTGSEATPYAVLTNNHGIRVFARSDRFFPDEALICGEFLTSVPRRVLSAVAFDAFTHALEALWSRTASPYSDAAALHALGLFGEHLGDYYDDPANPGLASSIAAASTLAGLAFGSAYTAACHALSFPISEISGLSHGKCCALTIAEVADFYASADSPALRMLADRWGLKGANEIPSYVRALKERLGECGRLRDHGFSEADASEVVRRAHWSMMENSIVPVSERDAERIFLAAL